MASRLHIAERMNKLSLLLLAACSTSSVESPNLPSTELIAHAEAAALCTADLHLPTRAELEEIFGNCDGGECTPCKGSENCSLRYGDDPIVAEGKVWSSTACEGGFLVGDFATGWISCAKSAQALPLCVR